MGITPKTYFLDLIDDYLRGGESGSIANKNSDAYKDLGWYRRVKKDLRLDIGFFGNLFVIILPNSRKYGKIIFSIFILNTTNVYK